MAHLQHPVADDFVVATGEQHSVREFVERSFETVGVEIEWKGKGVDEVGIAWPKGGVYPFLEGKTVVGIDPRYFRPTEVETLLGDYSKAKELLGWSPKTTFEQLVKEMVLSDLNAPVEEPCFPL